MLLAVRLQPGIYTERVTAKHGKMMQSAFGARCWLHILPTGVAVLLLLCVCTQQASDMACEKLNHFVCD